MRASFRNITALRYLQALSEMRRDEMAPCALKYGNGEGEGDEKERRGGSSQPVISS